MASSYVKIETLCGYRLFTCGGNLSSMRSGYLDLILGKGDCRFMLPDAITENRVSYVRVSLVRKYYSGSGPRKVLASAVCRVTNGNIFTVH